MKRSMFLQPSKIADCANVEVHETHASVVPGGLPRLETRPA